MQYLKAIKDNENEQRLINADKEDMHLQCKAIPQNIQHIKDKLGDERKKRELDDIDRRA